MKLKPPWELPGWERSRPIYLIALGVLLLNLSGLIFVAILLARARG